MIKLSATLLQRAKLLKREAWALAIAVRDPRCPWYVRALVMLLLAYIFSPIDLIPDFIPILGLVDEVILVPIAIRAIYRLMPAAVVADAQAKLAASQGQLKPVFRWGVLLMIAIWIILALGLAYLIRHVLAP